MTDLKPKPNRATPLESRIEVRRVRFVSGANVRQATKNPYPCLVLEQAIELDEVAHEAAPGRDTIDIIHVPPEAREKSERLIEEWFSGAETSEPQVSISAKGHRIYWRPGLALVEGPTDARDKILPALVEFAFYEAEVRSLEEEVARHEAQARLDVPQTFRIDGKRKAGWTRFGETAERLTELRLAFAALRPRIERGSRSLGKLGRAMATRLFRTAETAQRLDGLDAKLEACEDVYQDAVDRIADYRGWHTGHRLEVIIIALLVMEVVLMAAELASR